jgi:very-short-patch-repair endonuclease
LAVASSGVGGDRAVAAVASAQHGVVSYRQLLACGLGPGAIEHRLGQGRLHRVHRGVYAVGHRAPSFESRCMSAVLSVGRGAFVSHTTAARLHDVLPSGTPADLGTSPLHVSVTGRNVRHRPVVRVHRCGSLDGRDLRWLGPLPVASGARTALDVAAAGDRRLAERVLAGVLRSGLAAEQDVRALLDRSPGHAGLGLLGSLLDGGPAFDCSVAERRLLELLRRSGLPEPRMNVRVGPYEVDACWPDLRVVVEFDGFTFHGDRMAFRKDRRKSADLQARGFDVVPVVWDDLNSRPERVVAVVAAVLARASAGREARNPR